ncbi:MAG: alpha/beta fold hydrolase [Dehalococcoidia bacterium]
MNPTSAFVDTDSVRLHYVDWGGDRPPLVLVHATGFHARLWDPYAERLRDRFRVIAYDQRGHGDSSLPADGMDWSRLPADLYALIESLGIEGCFAAGHSSGGAAVGVCAALHPGSISRTVLIDPVLRDTRAAGGPAASNPMADRTRRRRAVWESPHQFEEAMRRREAFARWRPEFISLYAHHGLRRRTDRHYELKCPPDIEAEVYEHAPRFDPWPALARMAVPSLLLRAAGDEPGRGVAATGAAARIPLCREQVITASHFIPMEQPEQVLAALTGFFA